MKIHKPVLTQKKNVVMVVVASERNHIVAKVIVMVSRVTPLATETVVW